MHPAAASPAPFHRPEVSVLTLISCLIRLWYEKTGVFTPRQRAALRSSSLSRIICDNTGITSVPMDPFDVISNRNRLVRCADIRRLNLSAWRDNCTGETLLDQTLHTWKVEVERDETGQ